MNKPTHEHDRQPGLHEIADDITARFETDGVIDATQISAFIDHAWARLQTTAGVQIYSGAYNPAAIPRPSEGVQIIEPDTSKFESDQTVSITVVSADTSLNLSQSSKYVGVTARQALTSEHGEPIDQSIIIHRSRTPDSSSGGIVAYSENAEPLGYEMLAHDGQVTNPDIRPIAGSGLEHLKAAAEYIEALPAGSPVYHG